ncbi:hypothetical protein HK101_004464 [Irineochytrium annulatum]|nr:hypothetical protein HK101_004464 [Irineochytrium annulatum]
MFEGVQGINIAEHLKEGQTLGDVGIEALNELSRQLCPRQNAIDILCLICGWSGKRVPTVVIQHQKFPFGPCLAKMRAGWHYALKAKVSIEQYPNDNVCLRWLQSEIATLVVGGLGKTLDKREAVGRLTIFVHAQTAFPGRDSLLEYLEDANSMPMESLFRVLEKLIKRAAESTPPVTLPGKPRLNKVRYTAAEVFASVGTGHRVTQSDPT